jgi:hypothetical protein
MSLFWENAAIEYHVYFNFERHVTGPADIHRSGPPDIIQDESHPGTEMPFQMVVSFPEVISSEDHLHRRGEF